MKREQFNEIVTSDPDNINQATKIDLVDPRAAQAEQVAVWSVAATLGREALACRDDEEMSGMAADYIDEEARRFAGTSESAAVRQRLYNARKDELLVKRRMVQSDRAAFRSVAKLYAARPSGSQGHLTTGD